LAGVDASVGLCKSPVMGGDLIHAHASLRTAAFGATLAFLLATAAAATPIDDKYAELGGAGGARANPLPRSGG
jgi:hypothetical protein